MLPDSIYAMDTNFWTSLGRYSLTARCQMARELGYAGVYESLDSDFDQRVLTDLASVPAQMGVRVFGVYYTVDLHKAEQAQSDLARIVGGLGQDQTLELSVTASGGIPSRPEAALQSRLVELLGELLPLAAARRIRVLLYPHIWFYLERLEQAVAVVKEVGHPSLGVIFTGFHWYAVDGSGLRERLAEALPYLWRANICGSRRLPQGTAGLPATIECLDEGEMDNFSLLSLLDEMGFAGEIGLQGYSNGGDVYLKLQRSVLAYRSIVARVARRTGWASHV